MDVQFLLQYHQQSLSVEFDGEDGVRVAVGTYLRAFLVMADSQLTTSILIHDGDETTVEESLYQHDIWTGSEAVTGVFEILL